MSAPDDPDLAARAAAAAALLEEIAGDHRALAQLDDDLRRRLVTAAGQVSRPDRYARKALGKALARARVAEKRAQDRATLEQTGIRVLRKQTVFRAPLPMPKLEDEADDGGWGEAEAEHEESPRRVVDPRTCYVCKAEFHELHHFYDQMCAPCAELNWAKRNQMGDLRGRVALVTGARVKIGYHAALKLLRCGAETVVLTRFPRDAARRYAEEPDSAEWMSRLHVYGIDLRHTPSVEALCTHLVATLPRLDVLINNACQTVRRPSGWYDHVIARETEPLALPALDRWESLRGRALPAAPAHALETRGAHGIWQSAVLSQVPLLAEDLERGNHLFPDGRLDADLQQVDLRTHNSWRMALADVPTAELLEVHLVNAVAPFVLNARLKPLLARVPTRDAHVVNVSAMEGQFYRRWKTDKHPHTNMAKAALNMMTRTSAADYIKDGIHMNAVDTGWVTDEDPLHHAERKQQVHGFHPPLDIVDGAARIVDPFLDGVTTGNHVWGLFLKDYKPAPW
jgi:NAD(P)-dependent dehydrogenase (short-subunit alcohol dehydrogenase family)